MSAADMRSLTEFLRGVGAADVAHTGTTYLAHCAAVYRDMKAWGFDEDEARAGLFHSIYGTGLFQKFKLPLERRGEIRDLIGERAERLAYLLCAVDYESFDREVERGRPPYRMTNRFTGETTTIAPEDFESVVKLQLIDRLEQLPRSKDWEFRRASFRRMAERLGPAAIRRFDEVFAGTSRP